ncbi:MAG: glutamate racemase [Acidobacteriaceae bacterium]
MSATRTHPMGTKGLTIGVFDSGFGGLTVLRELLPLVPGSHFVYLGDTARLPYGSKSRETIVRYALSSARFLQQRGAQLLVVACNTATALALDELREALPIPVVGVIQPGVEAASVTCREAGTVGEVLVLATQATIESHAYARACAALGLKATEKACPLLVPLVEEGWIGEETPSASGSASDTARSSVTAQVLRIYLEESLRQALHCRALLLGCTHYPLLRPAIEHTLTELGRSLRVIDSAQATARTVARILSHRGDAPGDLPGLGEDHNKGEATCEFFATDSVRKFERLGSRFLGRPVEGVQLVDLGG